MDAGSVEAILVELDRMRCRTCHYEDVVDVYELIDWNERVRRDDPCFEQGTILPRGRFFSNWHRLGAAEGQGRETFLKLRAGYAEPHRAYHTAHHIGSLLATLDKPEVAALAEHIEEVEAALWFHDVIYNTRASDNEERSAEFARDAMASAGIPSEVIGRVCAHIRATLDHESEFLDGMLVIDIDLSILGSDPAAFQTFEDAIRREFDWVPEEQYRSGRAAVLTRFLERPQIYGTDLFRANLEERARQNLGDSLASLE